MQVKRQTNPTPVHCNCFSSNPDYFRRHAPVPSFLLSFSNTVAQQQPLTRSLLPYAVMACTRPNRNTLTSACFGACASPLCVVYAAEPTDAASRIGDGNYYYQGCAFAGMATCRAAGACDVQCLQASNARQDSWELEVAPPQKDKSETALFLHVENVVLPHTLTNLCAP